MVSVDNAKYTGCGSCVDVCPEQAITMHDNWQ
ncbi:4Fe-4S binding protein [Chloroflexota bacterium]